MTTHPRIAPALAHLTRPVEGLTPYPGNARNGDTDAIGASLEAHGQYAPIVYQRSTGYVLKGNHVLHAALEAGWTEVAATGLDVDDDTARRLVLVDNRTSDLGRYDDPLLLKLLEEAAAETGDLGGTGFSENDLLDLQDRIEQQAQQTLDAARASTPGGGGLGQAVVSYTLVFDDEHQQNVWYAFLKWLRGNVEGETIGQRVTGYLSGVVDVEEGR